jgi:hypothetical protein
LTALLREGIDALLPQDLAAWLRRARAERLVWRRDSVPMGDRKGRLLRALNGIYERDRVAVPVEEFSPWLCCPEDSWL